MKKIEELHFLEMPKEPWEEISINIIGLLPRSNGKDAIVVIVDWFTKIIWLRATIVNISSEEIIKIYWDKIWKLYGVPWKVLSNRGSQFVSRFIEDLLKVLGTKKILSTVSHSQTNGQTKQINQEIGIFLQNYVNYQ